MNQPTRAAELREATVEDARPIAELIREVGADLGWPRIDSLEVTVGQVRPQLETCAASQEHAVLVAEVPGERGRELAGYLALHFVPNLVLPAPVGYVTELFVRPGHRSRRLGSALLERAEALARERGCARLELHNRRDRESYERAFYAKRGWKEREEMAVFNRWLD